MRAPTIKSAIFHLLVLLYSFGTGVLNAQEVKLSLISEYAAIVPGKAQSIGILFEIEKNWHLYWKYAGDSGTAPKIKWRLPPGLSIAEIQWPYPKRIPVGPLVNFGYENELLLISELKFESVPDSPRPSEIKIEADIDWLVCQEDCYPGKGSVNISLPIASDQPKLSPQGNKFERYRKLIPEQRHNLPIHALEGPNYFKLFIEKGTSISPQTKVVFFPASGGIIENAAIQELSEEEGRLVLKLKKAVNLSPGVEALKGTLVSENTWHPWSESKALDISATIGTKGLPLNRPLSYSAFFSQLLLALFAGLLLNIMPCVFPVLSLKVLRLMELSKSGGRRIRNDGAFFALGVLFSFLFLALGLVFLKSTGQKLGWGFQLQSPYFVAGMSAFLMAIALNLAGVFEVGASLQRSAGKIRISEGHLGSFVDGVIATVLASPCSAPFMGGAIAYGLAASTLSTISVFTALALGMALPFLVLSMFPALVEYLPHPGAWMENFKKLMAFPLLATVAWLLWIYTKLMGEDATFILLLSLVGLSAALFIYGAIAQRAPGAKGRLAWNVVVLILMGISFYPVASATKPSRVTGASQDTNSSPWIKFSSAKFEELKSAGRPIFVDFTAAWCIMCQVNKKLVLNTKAVMNSFKEKGVVLMKADWTQQDEEITDALQSYGYQSVPLNVLYVPGKISPIIFPSVLTRDVILDALAGLK